MRSTCWRAFWISVHGLWAWLCPLVRLFIKCPLLNEYDLLIYLITAGIFPYVLRLLQSPAAELRQVLVFIWAKILAVERVCDIFVLFASV